VKQALFHVLLGADMPSALLEMGFISSRQDRRIAFSETGQARMAQSISSAIEEFKAVKQGTQKGLRMNTCQTH
jgi:N-acetylmuramoyl-L-alanine amidase